MKKISLLSFFSFLLSCLALGYAFSTYKKCSAQDKAFCSQLLHHARQCANYNDSLSEKRHVLNLLEQIEKNDCVVEQGSDDLRVKYVFSQGCIEHVLACSQAIGEIIDLIGMIHTPMPATPVCTKPEPLDDTVLDPSIRFDLDKLLSVRSRAHIIREYLTKGGVLYIVYPQGGLEKRTPQQQLIYREELANYPNNLIDWVLSTSQLHSDMVGATYFFKNKSHEIFVFSVKTPQANAPPEYCEWGVWLGEIKNPAIKKRVNNLFSYFKTCNGPTKDDFRL